MYEIWLALNILFELTLMYLPLVAGLVIAWIALMALAIGRGQPGWRTAIGPAALAGVAVMLAGLVLVPSLTLSSMSELKYWVDWANLLAIAAGLGAVAAAFALPIAASLGRRTGSD